MPRSKLSLRKRKLISHFKPEEPSFDEYVYCESCYDFVFEYCSIHGPPLIVPDNTVISRAGVPVWVPRAALTAPRKFVHIAPSMIPGAGLGVFSSVTLPRGVRFGPYRGRSVERVTSMYCWQVRKKSKVMYVDGSDGDTSNWIRYVNCARHWHEQNLVAFQYHDQIYYRSVKIIPKFTELLVYYGSDFAHALGVDLKNYNNSKGPQIAKYVIEDVNPNIPNANNQKGICETETLEVTEETPIFNNKVDEIENSELTSDINTDGDEKNPKNDLFTSNNDFFCPNLTLTNCRPLTTDNIINGTNTTHYETIEEDTQKSTLCSDYDKVDKQFDFNNVNGNQKVCDICNKLYKTDKTLKGHKIKVHGVNKRQSTYCNKTYIINSTETTISETNEVGEQTNMLSLNHNTVENQFNLNIGKVCDICNKLYKNARTLREHKIYVHGVKTRISTHCNKTNIINSTETTNFETNEVNEQTNTLSLNHNKVENQFNLNTGKVCDICNKLYKNARTLREHKIYVHGVKTRISTHCNKTYIINSTETTNFETNEVNEQTNTLSLDHNKVETQLNSNIGKVCDICNKLYRNAKSLREHTINVHKEKRFSCALCDYKTNKLYRLTSHTQTHKEQNVFACKLCSYVGYAQEIYNEHLLGAHGDN